MANNKPGSSNWRRGHANNRATSGPRKLDSSFFPLASNGPRTITTANKSTHLAVLVISGTFEPNQQIADPGSNNAGKHFKWPATKQQLTIYMIAASRSLHQRQFRVASQLRNDWKAATTWAGNPNPHHTRRKSSSSKESYFITVQIPAVHSIPSRIRIHHDNTYAI
ncbi:hypothetical protein ACLOJK_019012 [Asimina triloba]